jgi:hypothetical protein
MISPEFAVDRMAGVAEEKTVGTHFDRTFYNAAGGGDPVIYFTFPWLSGPRPGRCHCTRSSGITC